MRKLIFILLTNFIVLQIVNAQDLDQISLDKGVKVKGGISMTNIFYHSNDTIARRDPFQTILNGNLNINLFGYDVPFTFTWSNSQRSYTQPFNRFVFAPKYKWVKLYLGNTSMMFSPYTLAGHTFTGAGAELTPGNWRFSIMGGRLRKAVNYDTEHPTASIPSYKRMGYGLKAGYDKGNQSVSVVVFTAKDDIHSIQVLPPDKSLHPKQNLTLGISGRTMFLKHISLDGDYTTSILNTDLRAVSITPDSIANVNNVSGLSSKMPNRSIYHAFSGGVGYQAQIFGVSLRYERISPDYQTLGGYYFNNDLENITIAPSVRLLKGKMNIAANMGMQHNNLDGTRESTTKRWVGAGNISYNPNEKWSGTFNYSNFSTFTRIRPLNDPFFKDEMDSLNFYQVSNSFTGTSNYIFGKKESPQSILIAGSYQKVNEVGNGGTLDNTSDFISLNSSYSRTLRQIGLTMAATYNLNISDAPGLLSVYNGPGVNVSKSLFNKILRLGYIAAYNTNSVNHQKSSPVFANGLNMSLSPKKLGILSQNLSFNATWVQRFKSEIQNEYRSELTMNLNYSVNF